MPTRKNFRERKKVRREEAIERQGARDKRSDKEQYEKLKKGGFLNCKEANQLLDRMAKNAPSHKTSVKMFEIKDK